MKMWHCKKQEAFRREPHWHFSARNVRSPVADLRTRSTSYKMEIALAALLNDAIPVNFPFQIGT